jgi:predicted DNA-binding antitoxin AbrB/MazE fold protein
LAAETHRPPCFDSALPSVVISALSVRYNGRIESSFLALENLAIFLTVEAIYENGVLKPAKPLPLKKQEQVQITIASKTSWVQQTYGICGWKGSAEEAERFATDPDLDFPPPPQAP